MCAKSKTRRELIYFTIKFHFVCESPETYMQIQISYSKLNMVPLSKNPRLLAYFISSYNIIFFVHDNK